MTLNLIICPFLDGTKCKVAELSVSRGVCLDCLAKGSKGAQLKVPAITTQREAAMKAQARGEVYAPPGKCGECNQ